MNENVKKKICKKPKCTGFFDVLLLKMNERKQSEEIHNCKKYMLQFTLVTKLRVMFFAKYEFSADMFYPVS